jgi:hypothetical protein
MAWQCITLHVFIEVLDIWLDSIWTGATDRETDRTFKWNVGNGDRIYPNWYPGQPDSSNQDCLSLTRSANFADEGCFCKLVFVCEKNQNV